MLSALALKPTSPPSSGGPDTKTVLAQMQTVLYRRAMMFTGDRQDAWDAVQTTYERALRAGVDSVPASKLGSWLAVILRNVLIDEWRVRSRQKPAPLFDDVAATHPETEEPPAWLGFDGRDLQRALRVLTPKQRAVFELREMQGLSYAETAVRLGLPPGTVATRLLRARLQLKKILLEQRAAG